MKRFFPFTLLLILSAVILSACTPPHLGPDTDAVGEPVGMANPAAKHCIEQGYEYGIRKDANGNEYGVCIFADDLECDAWAYFRGECGPADQTSNLANPAAVYCGEQGFKYESRKDENGNIVGVCVFDDGSECDAWAYFRGDCGQNKAKNLILNLVKKADLDDTTQIDVIWLMNPDAKPGNNQPSFIITDPDDIRALLTPLDTDLPLTPPNRCPPVYELKFHHQSGKVDSFRLGICGLYGEQSYWKGLTIRTPEAFNAKFNEILKEAGMPR